MSLKEYFFLLSSCLTITFSSYGQVDDLLQSYNKHSIKPIAKAYVLYAKKVWREIYLDEKQNRPCFMNGKEISKVIIDGVKKDLLTPYKDDTLMEPMAKSQFFKNLQLPTAAQAGKTAIHEFFPNQISTLSLVEHVIFNKITARQEYDIESIQLIVPGRKNPPTHLDHVIATFKYKDLVDYFAKCSSEEVRWYNTTNKAENLTWMDAFSLRLFGSRIIKVENLDDATVDELYEKKTGDGKGLIVSQKLAVEIDIELEQFLSEY